MLLSLPPAANELPSIPGCLRDMVASQISNLINFFAPGRRFFGGKRLLHITTESVRLCSNEYGGDYTEMLIELVTYLRT
jgi:hypothetical protein